MRLLVVIAAVAAPVALAAQETQLKQGIALYERGQLVEAKRVLTAAQRAAPTAQGAYSLGRIAFAENDPRGAIDNLESATKLDPKNSLAFGWLGRAYALQLLSTNKLKQMILAGRVRGALENAVALDPGNADARIDLVRYYITAPGVAGGSMDRANQQAAQLVARSPFHGHWANALIAEKEKDDTRATTEWEAAVAAAPDSSSAFFSLAASYRRAQRWDDAWRALQRFAARRPGDPELDYHIGSTGAQSGQQLDRAERSLRTYLSRPWRPGSPTFSSAHFHLGEISERRGDRDVAKQEYNEALRLNSRNSQAKSALDRLH